MRCDRPLQTRWYILDLSHVVLFGDSEVVEVDAGGSVHCMCVGGDDDDARFIVFDRGMLDKRLLP